MALDAIATRCAAIETDEDAETLKEALLMTLADALTDDALATVNAPNA
jgi:hypothetical protein